MELAPSSGVRALPARCTHHPCSGAQSESSPTRAGFGGMREHPILLRFKTLTPESLFFLFLPPTCVCLQGLGALLPRPTCVPAPWVGAVCWGALCAWAALGLWRPGHPGLEDCVPPCTRPSLTRPSPLSAPAAGCWAGLALPRVRSRWQEAGSRHAFWARQGGAEGVGELGPQLGGGRCGPPGAASGAPSALGGAGVSDSGGSQTTRAWLCGGLLALHSFSLAS